MTERARTVFLGSGSFAVPIVTALADHPSVDLVAVVTAPTRRGARGRPADPPVAVWAAQRGLPMLRPARLRDPTSLADIEALAPDLLVLADYGQIVPEALLALPRHGALNLHPSLLPRHRGATPIPAAILNGDAETGVSLMLMDAGVDSGPLLAQARRDLAGTETTPELEADLARVAAELLASSTEPWLEGHLTPRPQTADGVTFTRLLRREDGRLDPARGAADLERQVRAYQPWPGSFIDTREGRTVVWRARVTESAPEPPGSVLETEGEGLGLSTSEGVLELMEVQPAGGRRMTAAELLRGRPGLAGTKVLPSAEARPGASA